MRHLGILLLGSISIAACASNENAPPPASADTVAEATVQPNNGPSFAPAASDGLATASGDTRRANSAAQPATTASTTSGNSGTGTGSANANHSATNGTWSNGSDGNNGVGVTATTGNAAAAPADTSAQPSASKDKPAPTAADNTRVNKRDKGDDTLTPMDQGPSEADRKMTQQIRQEVMKDKSLSFTAKNVKIITINGKVTLRGPVKTEAERTAIESVARRVAGSGAAVDSQLELAK